MSRGDALGLLLVLLVGLGGLSWIAFERLSAEPAPADGGGGSAGRSAVADSSRVPVRVPGEGSTAPADAGHGPSSRWNRAAIEALEAGEHARAIELFERCLEAVPDEPVFAANLAEALARLARVEHEQPSLRPQAIARLARATELAPQREDLAAELRRWRELAEAEAGFWTDESVHFHLSYDGSRDDLLLRGHRTLIDLLEDAYLELGELFGTFFVEAGQPKVQVVLYRRDTFDALTGIGDWAGGVFDGVVRVPVEDLEREEAALRRVLRHELAHAFVEQVGGSSVPGWLNEGLAQWLEEPGGAAREAQVRRARERLSGKSLVPLGELRGSLASWTDTDAIAVAYAQSLAFTDHLARAWGERVLYEMVAGCAAGQDPAISFRARTQVDLELTFGDLAAELERR